MKKQVEINFLCKNEHDFVKWYSEDFADYWETSIMGRTIHHYIFVEGGVKFHISFSDTSIVCSIIKNNREKDIYKGYKWEYCLKEIKKVVKYE